MNEDRMLTGMIGLEGLAVKCVIGVEPHERQAKQEIFIDLKVKADVMEAATTDRLNETVNYVSLAEVCKEIAQRGGYFLLEKCAKEIIEDIVVRFPTISWAWVRIKKPHAILGASAAFVELTFDRSHE